MIQIGLTDTLAGIRDGEEQATGDISGLLSAPDTATAVAEKPKASEDSSGSKGAGGGFSFSNEPAGDSGPSPKQRPRTIGAMLFGNWKRRSITGGAVAGAGGIVGAVMLFSVSSGPLEFIHISQILGNHFTNTHSAIETRMGKWLFGEKLGIRTAGDTRLNFLFGEVWFKNKILADLKTKGIVPEFAEASTKFTGYTVDATKLPDGLYKGSASDFQSQLSELTGLPKQQILEVPGEPGTFHVNVEGFFNDSKVLNGMVKLSNVPWLAQQANIRTLGRYGMVYRNWHILRKADANLTAKKDDMVKAFMDKLFGAEKSQAPAEIEATDPTLGEEGGKDIKIPGAPEGAPSAETTKSIFGDMKGFDLKSAAGKVGIAAAVLAIACIVYEIAHKIGIIRYGQLILPMIKMATTAVSVGNQIMTGQDVNIDEMDALEQQFNTIDAKTLQSTSTWSDAAPIQAAEGGYGGVDMDQGIKDLMSGMPDWLAAIVNNGVVNTACGKVVQGIATVISIAIIFVPGVNVVATIAGAVIGAIGTPLLVKLVSNLIAGSAVNVKATGAEWGNLVDYGSALSANTEAVAYGGVALTNQQLSELSQQQAANNTAQFHSESLADRLFNPYDYRSVVGNMIDQLNISSPQALFAKLSNIPAVIGALLSLPARIFSATVHADPIPYQYPFKQFGFSLEDLNNSTVQDPYANATAVSKILDKELKSGDHKYIDKALDCFGIAVAKGSDGWDAVPTTESVSDDEDRALGVNVYNTTEYNTSDCIDQGNADWLRVRFWIFDTRVIEGYACTLGDDTSCANTGFVGAGGA